MRKISIFSRDSRLVAMLASAALLASVVPSWAAMSGGARPALPPRGDLALQLAGEINVDNVGGPEDQEEPPVIRSLRPAKPAAPPPTAQAPTNSAGSPVDSGNPPKPGQAADSAKSTSGADDRTTTH